MLFIGFALLASCGPTKKKEKAEKLTASNQYSSISGDTSILADGAATSEIKIYLKDKNNDPMPDIVPTIEVGGTKNTIGTCSATDADGYSTCTLKSTKAETKTLRIVTPVSKAGTSLVFLAGSAVKLGFATQPSGGTANDFWVNEPVVEVWDAHDNRVPGTTVSVTLALQTGTGTLSGTLNRSTTDGSVKFTGLSLDTAGANKVLRATASGLTSVDSNVFAITAASGLKLSFNTQPGGGAAGLAWGAQPVVQILDASNAPTTNTDSVTLTLTSGTGALLGTKTVAAVNGTATFSGLSMTDVGAKTITATSSGKTLAVSSSFNITHGAAAVLSFSTQPGGGAVNAVWAQQPVVQIYDAYGNLCTGSSDVVVLSVNSGTGALQGTTSQAAASGVATFTDLKMSVSGTKRLRASVGPIVIDSNSFDVGAGAATKLVFKTEPDGGVAGSAWPKQPIVEAQDADGNIATSFTGAVTLSLTGGSGAIAGTLTVNAVSGVASFSGLKTNLVGADKRLTAASSGLTSAQTAVFAVTHASAYRLSIKTLPGNSVANTVISPQPVLEIFDQYDNKITTGPDASIPVTASLKTGDGALEGTKIAAASAGVVTYTDLKFTRPGAKVIRFTKPDTTGAGGSASLFVETPTVQATIGPKAKLAFGTQPGGGTAGVIWAQQPVVEIQDAAGNKVPNATDSVTIALQTGTGFLLGTTSVAAVAGDATFTNLKLNLKGAKVLRATAAGLTQADSSSFNIAHAIAESIFISAIPTSTVHTAVWSTQPIVEIRDAFQNVVDTGADATASVSISLLTGTGTLSGTNNVTAVGGVATFSGLSMVQVGDKTFKFTKEDRSTADASGELTVTSGTVAIVAGAANRLYVRTQPSGAVAGANLTTQPVVEIRDAANNLVTTATHTVTAAITGLTTTFRGTKARAAVGGLATFTDLAIDSAGSRTIRFTAPGLTAVNATATTVLHGLATQMVLTTEPAGAVVNTAFTTQPVLEIRDAYDNVITSGADSNPNVTVSVASGTGALSGALTRTAVAGVVTFSGLSINDIGSKTLRFTKPDTTGSGGASILTVDSTAFTVSPGAGNALSFNTQPGGGVAGVAWAQQPEVAIMDSNGYLVTTATDSVTLAKSAGAGVLSGTATVSAVGGIASFSGLNMDLVGANKTLTASGTGLTSATSNAFTITAAATDASSTVISSAATVNADNSSTATITVTLVDAFGNPGAGRSVSLVSDRGGSDTITTSPATANASGVATFTVKSGTPGTSTYTASEGAVTLSTTPLVTYSNVVTDLAQSSWTQDRVSIRNNNSDTVTFTVTLKNAAGDPLAGKSVSLTSSRGGSDTVSSSPSVTNGSGVATISIRSASSGLSRITLAVDAESLTITDQAAVQFLSVLPVVDLQSAFAYEQNALLPGTNSGPTGQLRNLASTGDDGVLHNFAYNTTSSGWMGDGIGSITGGVNGPYRLGFDGSNDYVNIGSGLNSASEQSFEIWARPEASTQTGRVILNSADDSLRGLRLRHAGDGSKRLEAQIGWRSTYAERVLANSPTAYFRLNEASGTTLAAVSGANGTISGSGVQYRASGALTSNDASLGFDGLTGAATLGTGVDSSGSLTLEAWIYPEADVVGVPRSIIAKESPVHGFALELASGNLVQMRSLEDQGGSVYEITSLGTTALSQNTWYHVVGVRDVSQDCGGGAGQSLKIYLNGNLEKCEALIGTFATTSAALKIASNPEYSGRNFEGRIDEVALYMGTVLSAGQISTHTNAHTVPTCYSGSALLSQTWFHAVIGFSTSTQTLSLSYNGTENCSLSTSSETLSGSSANLTLGSALDGGGALRAGSGWNGAIGEFRAYNQRLSGAQATSHRNAVSSKYP